MRIAILLSCVALGALTPSTVAAQEAGEWRLVLPPSSGAASLDGFGAAEEAPTERTERTRWEIIAPGAISLVVGYAGWAITSLVWNLVNTSCTSGYFFPSCSFNGTGPDGADILRSLIPFAGPWWSVAESETIRGADLAFPIVAGLAQAAGLVTLIIGLVSPEVRDAPVQLGAGPGGLSLSVPFE